MGKASSANPGDAAPDHGLTTVVELLQRMVAFDTVNPRLPGGALGEAPLMDYLERLARQWRLSSFRLPVQGDQHNLLLTCSNDADHPWLMLECHLDTVGVEGMEHPHRGHIADGRLWGRGACDAKGPAAAMLWAMHQFAQQRDAPNNVALLLTSDEEVTMTGVRHFLAHDYDRIGFVPTGVVVGEPTALRPVVAHNGRIRWRLKTRGTPAHAALAHRGKNAVSDMLTLLHAVERDYRPTVTATDPLTGRASCHVTLVHGGAAANVIPDRCVAEIDRRLVPSEDPDAVDEGFRQLIEEAAAQVAGGPEYELESTAVPPPLAPGRDGRFLGGVRTVLRSLGRPDDPVGAPYGAHAGYFGRAGLPTLILGPGDIQLAHTPDEHIQLDGLYDGVEVYLKLMLTPLA